MKPYFFFVLSVCMLSVLTEQRLSDDVVPTHYDVKLTIIPRKDSLSGNVCIKLHCKRDVSVIKLHAKTKNGLELKDDITLVRLSDNTEMAVQQTSYEDESDILTIPTPGLNADTNYKLCIQFTGKMSHENGYITYETTYRKMRKVNMSRLYMVATNFQRQSAFPCFDEPHMKAKFKVTLNVPYRLYKNLNVKQITYLSQDAERSSKWKLYPYGVKDTYSVEREVSPSQISFMVSTIPFRVRLCGFHNQLLTTLEFFGDWDPDLKPFYICSPECLFGVEHVFTNKYPQTIRFIIGPTKENLISWKVGLVLISESEIMGPSRHQRIYNILIRLTSQLFGGMITPDSWESNWLFTALAKYCAYLQMEKQPFLTNVPSLMMELPSKELDMNMNIFNKGTDIFQEEIVGTNKGLMLLQMIRSVLGDQFVPALRGFVDQFQYSEQSAGPNQLWQAFDKESTGGDNKWSTVMEQWTTQPSYPLVTVSVLEGGKITVTQEHFIGSYKKKMQNNNDKLCWMIPLSYSLFDTKTFKIKDFEFPKTGKWLTCNGNKEITINTDATEHELVLINPGYKSMYRVKYDDETLKKIIKTLRRSRLSIEPITRAQIVHDALSLAWMGYQDYKYVFSLLEFMEYEENDIVWNAFFSGAFHLNEILKASRETYVEFQAFVKYIMSNKYMKTYLDRHHELYNLVRWNPPTITPLEALFHSWACNVARIEICRLRFIYVFQSRWMVNYKTYVYQKFKKPLRSKYLFYTVLCSVLDNRRQYNEKTMKQYRFFIYDLLPNENLIDIIYQEEYANVLRCISDADVVESLLDLITKDEGNSDATRDAKRRKRILALADGPHTFSPTLEYFYNRIDNILKHFPQEEVLAELVKALTSKMIPDQISKMKSFVEENPELNKEKVLKAVEEGRATANQRAEWLARNDLQIRTSLKTVLSNVKGQ